MPQLQVLPVYLLLILFRSPNDFHELISLLLFLHFLLLCLHLFHWALYVMLVFLQLSLRCVGAREGMEPRLVVRQLKVVSVLVRTLDMVVQTLLCCD